MTGVQTCALPISSPGSGVHCAHWEVQVLLVLYEQVLRGAWIRLKMKGLAHYAYHEPCRGVPPRVGGFTWYVP